MLLDSEEERRRPIRNAVQKTDISYYLKDVSPFDGAERAAAPKTSRGGATDSQVSALVNLGVKHETALGYSKNQAKAVSNKLRKERCTTKQAKTLRKFGFDPFAFNVETASKQIQLIVDRGWKWP